jgi:hypothetical protein
MTIDIPAEAEYLTVEFAAPGGGTHRQRVAIWGLHGSRRIADVIAKAVAGAKRNRKTVGTCLRIFCRKAVLFSYVDDTTRGFR